MINIKKLKKFILVKRSKLLYLILQGRFLFNKLPWYIRGKLYTCICLSIQVTTSKEYFSWLEARFLYAIQEVWIRYSMYVINWSFNGFLCLVGIIYHKWIWGLIYKWVINCFLEWPRKNMVNVVVQAWISAEKILMSFVI